MTGKKIAAIIIIIIAAGAAILAFIFFGRKNPAASADAVYVQPVSSLMAGSRATERFSGIVETQKTNKTEFDSERKLDKLFVAEGDIVKEGADLFSYDTESLRLEIEQMKLEIDKMNMDITSSNEEINALNASLEKADSQDKPEYLASIKQLQADIAQTQYDIKSKESEINRKQAAINESVVKAKMGGIVEKIADAQDIIDGKSYTEDGSTDNTYITIRAEGDFRVKGKADEQIISRLSQGMEVIVRSRIDEKTWNGTISAIDTKSTESGDGSESFYPSETESASKYSFYVELDSTKDIMLGQHVIIEPGSSKAGAKTGIWLSSGFIVDEEGKKYVWAARDENAPLEKRTVVTGEYDEASDEYQITEGLAQTDLIAWADPEYTEGLPVTTEYTVPESEDGMDTGTSDESGVVNIDAGGSGFSDVDAAGGTEGMDYELDEEYFTEE